MTFLTAVLGIAFVGKSGISLIISEVLSIAVSLSEKMLKALDYLVSTEVYPSRSGAVQQKAIHDLADRQYETRLARECANDESKPMEKIVCIIVLFIMIICPLSA